MRLGFQQSFYRLKRCLLPLPGSHPQYRDEFTLGCVGLIRRSFVYLSGCEAPPWSPHKSVLTTYFRECTIPGEIVDFYNYCPTLTSGKWTGCLPLQR
jgi:hypothetical protein